eukprot:m.156382 g.156382  ORF g.156382 m.156382 type:complete len:80 (+) comp14322_c0_seq11:828-1067(+)
MFEQCTFDVCDVVQPDTPSKLQTLLDTHEVQKFSMISLFSITMWIHINCGDARFLEVLSEISGVTGNQRHWVGKVGWWL